MESRAKRIRIIRRTGFITFEFHHSGKFFTRARLDRLTQSFRGGHNQPRWKLTLSMELNRITAVGAGSNGIAREIARATVRGKAFAGDTAGAVTDAGTL